MKVAEEKIMNFPGAGVSAMDFGGGRQAGMVRTPLETSDDVIAHDARGLVISIGLTFACWIALAVYLLS